MAPSLQEYLFTFEQLFSKFSKLNSIALSLEEAFDERQLRRLSASASSLDESYSSFTSTANKLNLIYESKGDCQSDIKSLNNKVDQVEDFVIAIKGACLMTKLSTSPVVNEPNKDKDEDVISGGISLPKLDLPTFNGSNLLQWILFRDLFVATIHSDKSLSPIRKFLYLRNSLRDQALSVISSLPISSENYGLAWDLLNDRYNNPSVLTDSYLEALISLKNITRDNPSGIRNFAISVKEYLGALSQLGVPVQHWDVLLLFLFRKKMDRHLIERWESSNYLKEGSSIDKLVQFLLEESRILDCSSNPVCSLVSKPTKNRNDVGNRSPKSQKSCFNTSIANVRCFCCNKAHEIVMCPSFVQCFPRDRFNIVKKNNLCLACFSPGHSVTKCPAGIKCCYCQSAHHSLLHFGRSSDKSPRRDASRLNPQANASCSNAQVVSSCPADVEGTFNSVASCMRVNGCKPGSGTVLLMTAIVHVQNSVGRFHRARILLDPGSQGNFVTLNFAKSLGLTIGKQSLPIYGLGNSSLGSSHGVVDMVLQKPFEPSINFKIDAFVINKITSCPELKVPSGPWPHLRGLHLADPTYYQPGEVDMLIGAEVFVDMITCKKVIGPKGTPSAIETILGYCLVGKVNNTSNSEVKSFCTLTDLPNIQRFWEIEEPPSFNISVKEDPIETWFRNNTSRLPSGRYCVKLPFRSAEVGLSESRNLALRRFFLLEGRLSKNPSLAIQYRSFMEDYLSQGHMVRAKPLEVGQDHFFVPHHCIERPKFKVVFDFSMQTRGGPSLNQVLQVGKPFHTDMLSVLFDLRFLPVVLMVDIRQMYRNIALDKDHWDFQRVFWRDSPDKELLEYNLVTLSYGVVSAPYLAVRTLHQLVEDEGNLYPLASQAILSNAYMDDVCKSIASVSEAIALRDQLIELFAKAKFTLRKWVSNHPAVLEGIDPDHCEVQSQWFALDIEDRSTKVLGLMWNPLSDSFSYRISPRFGEITKRTILSDMAKVFDPFGFLSPTLLLAKLLLRDLWQLGLGWDDQPPISIIDRWLQFRSELPLLEDVSLLRCIGHLQGRVDLHAFSDSSEKAYASCLYLRIQHKEKISTCLLLAKSKVAPLKYTSLPRLELCGIYLAAKLIKFAKKRFDNSTIIINSVNVWSDSMIALHWVGSPSLSWKTFVANRVAQIQEVIDPSCFRYVPTEFNPCDCASRGIMPSSLISHALWWAGGFIAQPEDLWPTQPSSLLDSNASLEEARSPLNLNILVDNRHEELNSLLHSFSSFVRLRRVTAYCLRFVSNCRKDPPSRTVGVLSGDELRNALYFWIRFVQASCFSEDLNSIKQEKIVSTRLRVLNPFVDDHGLIRVGGRLAHATIPFDKKFPILLPKISHLTDLIVDFYHHFWLHPGPNNLHGIIQNQFWIISGRSVVRNRVHKCVKCFRYSPRSLQPFMGDLPPSRLRQVKAFSTCGVDYAGPIPIRLSTLRKARVGKAYLCLFVCFSTKAIHLELATDLTSNTFLAALRRFIARRGSVEVIYSDNGTNFHGAKRQLDHWSVLARDQSFDKSAQAFLSEQGIKWQFLPPASPFMGGLHEAGIKSTKRLLLKAIGDQALTFEELYTFVVQVEAILNSRPLTPISSDPNDLQALTPGHFLLQEAPSAIVEPHPPTLTISHHKRWKLIQQMVSSFWARWHLEYLGTLQSRYKWNKKNQDLIVGSLVLIREPHIAPLRWRLGRVIRTFPGADNIVRVAEVKTSNGILVRPAAKLCPLPFDQ